jgi:acetyltransferase-like isoleucine patch superfamily enzyme
MARIEQGVRAALNALRHRNVSYRSVVLGDIEVASSASVGPGCVLKADEESRIVIGPNVEIQRECRLFARNGGEIRIRDGATVKKGTKIMPHEKGFAGSATIGEETVLHRNNSLDITGDITIGPDVRTGEHSYIHTHTHPVDDIEQIWDREPSVGSVAVGEGCWIGTMCQLMPGSGMPAHSVLAAGGVVTDTYEARGVFGGIPAERIKDL